LAPGDATAAAGCATILAELGRREEAVRFAELALNRKSNPSTLAELAGVFLALGDRPRAAGLVDRALQLDPRCAAALVVRARLKSGRAAVEDIAEALQIDSGAVAAYRVRAGLRDQTTTDGRREAVADWNRVLELSPADAGAIRERARLYAALKEPKRAVADWSRLTELEPIHADNWIGLARARFAEGDRSGAADALRSALQVDPARVMEVFDVVRGLARALEDDNPADRERVAEWRLLALSRLAAWVPK